jgi:phosphotriesterase-related protein
MAEIIRTTAGDRRPEDCGVMLFHEHLHFTQDFLARLRADPAVADFHFEDIELLTREILAARAAGVTAMVDAGHDDMGRDLGVVKELARRTGLWVILGGGYYLQRLYPPSVSQLSAEQLADDLLAAAQQEGWGTLGEIGTSATITADEHKVLRAIGAVHRATGLSVITHTEREGLAALDQLTALEAAGVDPTRLVIGHLGGLPDTVVHRRIMARGAWVGFDRVSRGHDAADDQRQARQIADLVERGGLGHILVSGDQGSRRADLVVAGGPGYAKPWTVFAPALSQVGLSPAEIRTIFVDNPRRCLAFTPR